MRSIDFKNLSNNEIGIELKKLENEYEATKVKISELINKMKGLDELYLKGKDELNNRKKGLF